jgi:hypothetical protein
MVLGLGTLGSASNFQIENMNVRGDGCQGIRASIDSNSGQQQLVVTFDHLKSSVAGALKRDYSECRFSIPFTVAKTRSVKFSNPFITGNVNLAPRVKAKLSFEMAWPDHRGPVLNTGYNYPEARINEEFSDTSVGTEIVFSCGESNEIVGVVGALLETGWLYRGEMAELNAREVRLNIEDVPCVN